MSRKRMSAEVARPGAPGALGGERDGTAGIPDAAVDDLDVSDEELEAQVAALDPARPTEHQLAGGAPRGLAWLLTIGGALGAWAAVMLVLSEIEVARDPDAALACDFNPLIGCGTFITTWQAHLFGIPNAVVGTVAFAALTAVGVMLLARARPARWFWVTLTAAATLAILWVFWFQYQALFSIRGLCPYCLVVWTVMIPIFVNVWARSLQAGHVRVPDRLRRTLVQDRLRRTLVQDRWIIVAAWYAAVVLAVAWVFWDQWLLLLA
ncbi:vitamin K epoxide reductase family protein [Georgenia sp. SYP-B2076]|uniref:vitamin K epoxide reductase family protein n=1 Tax=Georgenia sp. SYP-B2076 TaxID=2495881 RepID=UPI000F8F677C|nr:vitamin K epoxide reductase family protein [Georgenia sp. SYP-B2076]